jgi:hypothetical protein
VRTKALTTILALVIAATAIGVWHQMSSSPTGTGPIARLLTGVGRTQVAAPPCVDEGVFGCFFSGPTTQGSFITRRDLTSMAAQLGTRNQAKQQALMQQLFANYKARLQAILSEDAFSGITDDGLAAVFAVTAAYELKQAKNPDPSYNLNVIMLPSHSKYGLLCQGYVALADQLFYLIKPKPSSAFQIQILGIGRDSPVDNHVTMATTGTGVPLFIDPTTSIVAAGGALGLLDRKPMPFVQFPVRDDAINIRDGFRSQLQAMVRTGTLDYRSLMYAFPASAAKYRYRREDLINVVTWENIQNRQGFFFLTVPGDSRHGMVWQVATSGLAPVSAAGIASIVAVDGGVFALGLNGTLWEYTATGAPLIHANVAQIAPGPSDNTQSTPGPNDKAIYVLFTSGALSLFDINRWHTINGRGTQAVIGTGDSTFMLKGGALYQTRQTQQWTLIGSGYDGISGGYPARLDLASNPVCTKASPCNGEYYAHTTAPYGREIIARFSSGAQQILAKNVSTWGISPLRGISVNMLVGTQIYRWDSVAVPNAAFNSNKPTAGRYRNITAAGWTEVGQRWLPGMPAGGIHVSSMALINQDIWLQAVSTNGTVYQITSGTL